MDDVLDSVPGSMLLTKLITELWPRMVPPGNVVECPPMATLSLVIDSLKYYRLIDINQESSAIRVVKSAMKARASGKLPNFVKELEMLSDTREGDDGKELDELMDKVIGLLSNRISTPEDLEFDEEAPTEPVEKRVFSTVHAVIAATTEEGATTGRARYMPKLQGLAEKKIVVKPGATALDKLQMLKGSMPNFADVLDDVIIQVKAQVRLKRGIKLHPMLLLGKPGIGKTRFIKKLAECLDAESHVFHMGGSADTIKLRGVSKGWGSARPGDIATKLAHGKTFNPFFLFDEIEKAQRDGNDALHDVHGLLLSYLEAESSKTIEDDYCGFPMDLTGVNYVFTANTIGFMPDAFMSRVETYNIPDLTTVQFLNLGRIMFYEINRDDFDSLLKSAPIDVIKELVKCDNARELRRLIYHAIARAVGDGAEKLSIEHLKKRSSVDARPTMGFV